MGRTTTLAPRVLTDNQREQFMHEGFVCSENAFPSKVAAIARAILWLQTGCDPQDPKTWTRPVIRIRDCAQEPFRRAANSPVLHSAFDELVGSGRWLPREPWRFSNPLSERRRSRRHGLAYRRELCSR
jgi:hypothetical protein